VLCLQQSSQLQELSTKCIAPRFVGWQMKPKVGAGVLNIVLPVGPSFLRTWDRQRVVVPKNIAYTMNQGDESSAPLPRGDNVVQQQMYAQARLDALQRSKETLHQTNRRYHQRTTHCCSLQPAEALSWKLYDTNILEALRQIVKEVGAAHRFCSCDSSPIQSGMGPLHPTAPGSL
jgi:hypothetical protein